MIVDKWWFLIIFFLIILILQYTISLAFNIKIFKIKRNRYVSAAIYGVYATFISSITIPLIAWIAIYSATPENSTTLDVSKAIYIVIIGALGNSAGSFLSIISIPVIFKKQLKKEQEESYK
ncbi:MAG: hypothetical protein HPPSJP_0410 [Candidatus Hepatoplasma scabrum]|nr:MAG: hypothetical protein HPPSJP_0410 [Candidatus Hepatoplasma sp.]